MDILNYLGFKTKKDFVFHQINIAEYINDKLRLSAQEYIPKLYQVVVRELALRDSKMDILDGSVMSRILAGNIPSKEEMVIRSQEFEDNVGKATVGLFNPNNQLCGIVINTKPKAGYHYKSGKKDDKYLTNIAFPELNPQAHNWSALFSKEVQGKGYSIFSLLAVLRLSEQEGASFLTTYTSADSKNLSSTKVANKLIDRIGLELKAHFFMYDDNCNPVNEGNLYALDIKKNNDKIRVIEEMIVHHLFYEK